LCFLGWKCWGSGCVEPPPRDRPPPSREFLRGRWDLRGLGGLRAGVAGGGVTSSVGWGRAGASPLPIPGQDSRCWGLLLNGKRSLQSCGGTKRAGGLRSPPPRPPEPCSPCSRSCSCLSQRRRPRRKAGSSSISRDTRSQLDRGGEGGRAEDDRSLDTASSTASDPSGGTQVTSPASSLSSS
jgi:hypothetical protein